MKSLLVGLAWIVLLLPTRAAEPGPPAPSTNAMIIVCDGGFEYVTNTAIYRQNVQVLQADMTLHCELLTVYFETNGGQINMIVAETNVFITQGDSVAIADRAVYTATNELVVLTGDALVDTAQGYLAGAQVIYDRKTTRTFAPGKVFMGTHPGTNRMAAGTFAIPLPGARTAATNRTAAPPPRTKSR